jgi:cell division protein ZapA (FtsZ GTPase activity inhibitor)
MSEQKLIRFNLMIGGRSFPVKVEKAEVADLKRLEGEVNAKINEFMVKYPNYERIDLQTMAFLALIFDLNKERFEKSAPVLEKRLDDLAEMLDSAL